MNSPRFIESLLERAFGRPQGLTGRVGGWLLSRGKTEVGHWLIAELALAENACVLDVGCGPGVLLALFSDALPQGRVIGIDPSATMLRQASRRNARAVDVGRIELRRGAVENLPVSDDRVDIVVALNSMQFWDDQKAGLQECRRVLRDPGMICLGFTSEAGPVPEGLDRLLDEIGFSQVEVKEGSGADWTFARVP